MKLSIILLDRFIQQDIHSLHFLEKQSVPREEYELIWVELYDYKVVPEIIQKTADKLICCHQKNIHEKHKGYNAGLLAASGDLVCICDSDAIFPFDFVEKIQKWFTIHPKQHILQVHEHCTTSPYPGTEEICLNTIEQEHEWQTCKNDCSCGVFLRKDMIMFGGFDEDKIWRGTYGSYLELLCRLVNSGWEGKWASESDLMIWRFGHLTEADKKSNIHFIEIATNGRIQAVRENPKIKKLRLSQRKFGSELEQKYTNPSIYRRESYKRFTGGWISKLSYLLRYAKKYFL